MKFSKVAAVVAGSVAVLGAGAPAFAADAAGPVPMSLNGGAFEVLEAGAPLGENLGGHLVNALDEQGSAVGTAVEAVGDVNKAKNNLPGEALKTGNALTQASPLLGGVKLNGGK
ncbi:hypothetical protein LG634_16235 [Streptomyces bambusae]|uniref:hypothetical protein n=1 Tax=Streptomyces bambusae TaxID=1550616 RepID=UPI001CFF2991|nr:hypothetical protein [Streptomyces bambusae]MCB5166380.1 hypothetical protein [Streptomyces bambusae]